MPYKNKERRREADKRYRERNREKEILRHKRYYEKNRKKILEEQKQNLPKHREYNRKSYYKHKEARIKKQLERYYKKKKEISEQRKAYRNKNPEKFKERAKEYHSRPEVKKKRREYENSSKQREKKNNYIRKKKIIDKDFAIGMRLRRLVLLALQRELKKGKNGSSKRYGINYKKIIENLKPFPKDLSKYEIDHIIPISSFKLSNKDGSPNFKQIKNAFSPSNHQWLTIKENRKKSDNLNWRRE